MKWYYFLNKCTNSLLGKERITKDRLPVCSESNGYKEFASFRYLQLFNYSLSLSDEKRCLFEIILGNRYQKIYYDIDIDLDSTDTPHTREQKLNISEQLPEIIKRSLMKEFPQIQENQILIFGSHSQNKRSYHIVTSCWCVTSNDNNRKVFDRVLTHVPEPWKRYVDHTMYKSVQYFRCYMSTKYGKGRIKDIDTSHSRWELTEYSDNPLRDAFLASLISYTTDCQVIPIDEDEDDGFINYEKVELTNEDEHKIREIIHSMPYSRCFKIAENKNSMIVLRRMLPSYCPTCERVHEHENPFVYATASGNVNFNCRRNQKSTIIGNLNDKISANVPKASQRIECSEPFFKVEKQPQIEHRSEGSKCCSIPQIDSLSSVSSGRTSNASFSPCSSISSNDSISSVKSNVSSESWRVKRRKQDSLVSRLERLSIDVY